MTITPQTIKLDFNNQDYISSSQASGPESLASQKVEALFIKALTSSLSEEEKTSLREIKKGGRLSNISFYFNKDHRELLKQINTLKDLILTGMVSSSTVSSEGTALFQSVSAWSSEQIDYALAELTLQTEKLQIPLQQKIASLIDKKSCTPSSQDILAILEQHNTIHGSELALCGQTIAHVSGMRIYYNTKGFLCLGTQQDRILRQMSSPTVNLFITKKQLSKIKDLYYSLVDRCPYNNLSPFLEMLRFYHEAKKANTSLSMKEAFASFTPDPIALFDKYQSGTCLILSAKVSDELSKIGVTSMHLGENVVNRWNTLPVVNIEGEVGIPWQQNKLEAENAGHIRTFIRYKNPKMQDGALILEGGFEHDQILSYRPELDRNPLQSLKRQNPHTDFRPITSLSSLLKKRIAANFKMIVCLPGEIQSHLGIDLLQGNIYMSSQAISKVYPYIPLTERGRVHIDLKKVIDPLHIDTFFINGYPLELNHRQALQILIDQISPQFKLPSDTYDNILLVCQHVDEFFSVLATAPLTMLKEEYQDIQKINSCYAQFMHKLEQAKKASRSSKVPPHIQELVRQVSPIIERIKLALDESDHLLLKKSIKEFFKAQK